MSNITDSLGIWENLGTITVGDNWQLFNSPIIGESSTLRFTYNTNWAEWKDYKGNQSFGLIRFYYPTANVTVSPSFKIYPKQEQEIRTFNNLDTIVKDIGCKRINYYHKRGWYSAISIDWTLTVEVLLSEDL